MALRRGSINPTFEFILLFTVDLASIYYLTCVILLHADGLNTLIDNYYTSKNAKINHQQIIKQW
jgi:uncharacterized protein YvpB